MVEAADEFTSSRIDQRYRPAGDVVDIQFDIEHGGILMQRYAEICKGAVIRDEDCGSAIKAIEVDITAKGNKRVAKYGPGALG